MLCVVDNEKCVVIAIEYRINHNSLLNVESIHDWWILLDRKLSYGGHIENIGSEATRIYFTLLRSKLEYGSLIWSPIYEKYVHDVGQVQRKFLSLKLDRGYPERVIDNNLLLKRIEMDSLQKHWSFQNQFSLIKW